MFARQCSPGLGAKILIRVVVWRPGVVVWRPGVVVWRPGMVVWRPGMVVWRPHFASELSNCHATTHAVRMTTNSCDATLYSFKQMFVPEDNVSALHVVASKFESTAQPSYASVSEPATIQFANEAPIVRCLMMDPDYKVFQSVATVATSSCDEQARRVTKATVEFFQNAIDPVMNELHPESPEVGGYGEGMKAAANLALTTAKTAKTLRTELQAVSVEEGLVEETSQKNVLQQNASQEPVIDIIVAPYHKHEEGVHARVFCSSEKLVIQNIGPTSFSPASLYMGRTTKGGTVSDSEMDCAAHLETLYGKHAIRVVDYEEDLLHPVGRDAASYTAEREWFCTTVVFDLRCLALNPVDLQRAFCKSPLFKGIDVPLDTQTEEPFVYTITHSLFAMKIDVFSSKRLIEEDEILLHVDFYEKGLYVGSQRVYRDLVDVRDVARQRVLKDIEKGYSVRIDIVPTLDASCVATRDRTMTTNKLGYALVHNQEDASKGLNDFFEDFVFNPNTGMPQMLNLVCSLQNDNMLAQMIEIFISAFRPQLEGLWNPSHIAVCNQNDHKFVQAFAVKDPKDDRATMGHGLRVVWCPEFCRGLANKTQLCDIRSYIGDENLNPRVNSIFETIKHEIIQAIDETNPNVTTFKTNLAAYSLDMNKETFMAFRSYGVFDDQLIDGARIICSSNCMSYTRGRDHVLLTPTDFFEDEDQGVAADKATVKSALCAHWIINMDVLQSLYYSVSDKGEMVAHKQQQIDAQQRQIQDQKDKIEELERQLLCARVPSANPGVVHGTTTGKKSRVTSLPNVSGKDYPPKMQFKYDMLSSRPEFETFGEEDKTYTGKPNKTFLPYALELNRDDGEFTITPKHDTDWTRAMQSDTCNLDELMLKQDFLPPAYVSSSGANGLATAHTYLPLTLKHIQSNKDIWSMSGYRLESVDKEVTEAVHKVVFHLGTSRYAETPGGVFDDPFGFTNCLTNSMKAVILFEHVLGYPTSLMLNQVHSFVAVHGLLSREPVTFIETTTLCPALMHKYLADSLAPVLPTIRTNVEVMRDMMMGDTANKRKRNEGQF